MTLHQIEAFVIVASMLGLFMWGRLRHDLVAMLALSAGVLTGVVPTEHAFSGFSNPVIIIIASVLVLSRAIAASGAVEFITRGMLRRLSSVSLQVGALSTLVAGMSAFVKNVGALGIFIPIAVQTAERGKGSPSAFLMPLAFASLIGGTITQIGTSPNLLISTVRQNLSGQPFSLFDFTPVGLPLTALAIIFLSFGWRLVPNGRKSQNKADAPFRIEDYLSEAIVPETSPFVGKTVQEVEEMGDGVVSVTAIVREGKHRYIPDGDWRLFEKDVLVLQADPAALKPFLDLGQLSLVGGADLTPPVADEDDLETVEAVILADSPMVGQASYTLHLRRRYGVNILALNRGIRRITTRLSRTRFEVGDVIVLQGHGETLQEAVSQLGCAPLTERHLAIGRKRPRLLALGILVGIMALVSTKVLPLEVGFFIAAVLVVLLRLVSLKEAYDAVEWPIIIMLGALIPVGESLQSTGATGLVSDGLTAVAVYLPAQMAVGLVLLTSMLVTPFLHHAAAVLVMGPIAATLAANLGLAQDPFLMAVALGASCDFLTPIGHQNNMLVMGPGGYRFGDYWRLGLPLSCLVLVIGTPLILLSWPLH